MLDMASNKSPNTAGHWQDDFRTVGDCTLPSVLSSMPVMDTANWSCPDADEHGFVPFELIRKETARKTREQFLEAFPAPALLAVVGDGGPGPSQGAKTVDPNDSGVQLLTVSIKSTAILRYLGKLAFVTKRPGNPFAHLISVGRSANNDITVAVDSVSKVHGYFVREGKGWSFTDHGSTNGSTMAGKELERGGKYTLHDGAVLQLGLEASLQYLTPESLYARAFRK